MENPEGSVSFRAWTPWEWVRNVASSGVWKSPQDEHIRILASAVMQTSASAQLTPQDTLIRAIQAVRQEMDLFGDTQRLGLVSFLTNFIGLTKLEAKRFSSLQELFVNYLALCDAEVARLTESHDFDLALKMLNELRNVISDPVYIPMRKARIYALKGEYDRAITEIEEFITKIPSNDFQARAACFAEIARNYVAIKNFPKAYESFCTALNLDPNKESYHRELLEILLHPSVLQQTGLVFIEGYFNSIMSALQNEDFVFPEYAFKFLIKSLQALYGQPLGEGPPHTDKIRTLTDNVLNTVGETLFLKGKYELVQSLAQLESPVFQTPLWKARIYTVQGKHQQAIAELESMLKMNLLASSKDRALCFIEIGRNYAASGHIPKAYEAFCNAINLDPTDDSHHLELLQALFNPVAIQQTGFIWIQDYISRLVNASHQEGFQVPPAAYQFLTSSLRSQFQSLPREASLEELEKSAKHLEIDWILKNLPTCRLSELTEKDKQELQPIIRFAIGNRDLNGVLRSKNLQNEAAKFLLSLSFYTQEPLHPIISRINESLEQSGLRSLIHGYSQVSVELEQLRREIASRESYPDQQEFEAMQACIGLLTCLPYLPSVEQALTTHRQALGQLARARLPQQLLAKIIGVSTKIDEFAHAREQILARVSALLEDSAFTGLVRPQDMHIMEKCDYHLVEPLDYCKPSGGFSDPVVSELEADVVTARNLAKESDSLLQVLPGYMPGDLLIQDEVRYNAYSGSSKPLYSALSSYSIKTWGSLLHGVIHKDIFGIQPFFTGAEQHSALVNTENGELTRLEIVQEYQNEPLGFSTSLIDVCYRPKFLSQLTVEGLSAVTEMRPGATPDQIEQWLSTLNARCLYEHVTKNAEEFKALHNDGMRAMLGWIRSKIPGVIGQYAGSSITKASELFERLASLLQSRPIANEERKDFMKMFCSEFNAIVIVAVQKHLESMLNMMLQQLAPGHVQVSFFKQIIPPSYEPQAINPGRLKQIILANGYSEVPPPIAAQILCGRRRN